VRLAQPELGGNRGILVGGRHDGSVHGSSRRRRPARDCACEVLSVCEPTVTSPLLFPAPRHLRFDGSGAPANVEPRVVCDPNLPAEGFTLTVAGGGVTITHADDAGARWARALLAQLRHAYPQTMPGLRIEDWPDFPVRGFMLDVSRDRVPTRATLERLVELLGLCRVNHLQLYTEHTFAYAAHETVWRDASPLTPDDVRWLDGLCRARGIELAANQNGFGHMDRWLKHERYRPLAECPGGWQPSAGGLIPPAVLAPSADSLDLVLGLYRELLPCFSSRRINIGCDETFELGKGRSAGEVGRRGRGRVYLDFVARQLAALHDDGREVLFWGDVVRQHPELAGELPRADTVALVWHYEAPGDTPPLPEWVYGILGEFGVTTEAVAGFRSQVPPFVEQGVPFWVCPGTSSWNSLLGRLPNARANLLDAVEVGRAGGAGGVLITDWGDNGHHQPPSVSIAPLVYGAGVAWCRAANASLPLAAVLDRLVFDDAAGTLGAALETSGAVYDRTGLTPVNGSPLHTQLLTGGLALLVELLGTPTSQHLDETLGMLDDARIGVERSRPRCADGETVRRELLQAIRLARHGAWRIARKAGLAAPDVPALRRDLAEAIVEQRACWLLRSRPGGLDDSVARLDETLAGYA